MFYLSQFCCVHYYFCIDVSNMYIRMAFPTKPSKPTKPRVFFDFLDFSDFSQKLLQKLLILTPLGLPSALALALVWPCSSFWPPWGSLLAFRSLAMPASRTQNGKHRSRSGRTSLEPLGLGIVCNHYLKKTLLKKKKRKKTLFKKKKNTKMKTKLNKKRRKNGKNEKHF